MPETALKRNGPARRTLPSGPIVGPGRDSAVGEGSGVSADTDLRQKWSVGGKRNDWFLWQLVDSAFPTGGFAHSGGLEAAWQHGEVRNRSDLLSFLEVALDQATWGLIPFVTAVHEFPDRLSEVDRLFDTFTTNHVANRASRSQGKALLTAAEKIFSLDGGEAFGGLGLRFGHLAPAFGYVTGKLGIPRVTSVEMFVFNHLRSLLAAAVRLTLAGPMEAQILQFRLGAAATAACQRGGELGLDDVAQTAPLPEIWQGAQDRLYSRLFQS